MKNAVPKNDKKKRKQLTEEIAKLEADLSQKHEEEVRQLKSTTDTEVMHSADWQISWLFIGFYITTQQVLLTHILLQTRQN